MKAPISQQHWIEHLRSHLPVAILGEDPEGIHQVRVAAQRMRVWLQLGRTDLGEAELKRFRRALSRIRDLDVHLQTVEHPALRAWLVAEWERERPHALTVLQSPDLLPLLHRLENLPPVKRKRALKTRRRLARRAIQRGDRLSQGHLDREDFHRLRRSVRRVRYAQEHLGEDHLRVKALQSALGHLNDAYVALDLVADHPEPAAIADWVEPWQQGLVGLRAEALAMWQVTRPHLEKLSSTP